MSGTGAVAPKHAVRATRSAGQRTRSKLLNAASRLFKERGLADVSIADIAAAADAFPSQITYYFHAKEALFVEAACRDVLYLARGAEEAASGAATPEAYTGALVERVIHADAIGFFIEAMTLARRRPELALLIERTVQRLHQEGLRAYAGEMARRGWRSRRDPALTARRFWTIAIGVTIEGQAVGRSAERMVADMLHLLEAEADAPLRLVADDSDSDKSETTAAEKTP